jgi:hypothetical protein
MTVPQAPEGRPMRGIENLQFLQAQMKFRRPAFHWGGRNFGDP